MMNQIILDQHLDQPKTAQKKMLQHSQPLTFRSLHTRELDQWINFLFAIYQTSKDSIASHFYLDPHRDVHTIFVAVTNEGNIVASVRVFHRDIHLSNQTCKVGAIGQVATQAEYRGKGIDQRLLQMALDWMKQNQIPLSTLHTDQVETTASLYQSLGYVSVPIRYRTLKFHFSELPLLDDSFSIRKLDLHYIKQVRQVSEIYNEFCTSNKLVGTIVRNENYWTTWMQHDATDGIYGVFHNQSQELQCYMIPCTSSSVATGNMYRIDEFCFKSLDKSLLNASQLLVLFSQMIEKAMTHITKAKTEALEVLIPEAIASKLLELNNGKSKTLCGLEITDKKAVEDAGVMYKAMNAEGENVLKQLQSSATHSLFRTDLY